MIRDSRYRTGLLLLLCLLAGAGFSVLLGQDAFWDLKNYHLYNAWAFLQQRYAQDITAAGLQSFFNPLPDLPLYLLGTGPLNDFPRLLAAYQGLWFGALLFVLIGIAGQFARWQQRRFGWADGWAVLIGISGSMAVSQAGLSSNEVPLAALVLLGLWQLMPLYAATAPARHWPRVAFAGLCCGLAAGFKPTAVVFAPALALALGLSWRPRIAGLYLAVLALAAAGLGFALSYGWWGWHLFRLTGNPVFPLFNQIFHSDWTALANLTDERFKPRSPGQWLFYPFYWIKRNFSLVTELRFADPRYALAMLALGAMTIAAWQRPAASEATPRRPSVTVLLVSFVATGYVLWLVLYSILRYAIPLEALTGLLMLMAAQAWFPATQKRTYAMAVLCALSIGSTKYPNWQHAPFSRRSFDVAPLEIEPGSTVVLLGKPDAYLALFFAHPQTLQFIGMNEMTTVSADSRLAVATRQRLQQHTGPLYAIRRIDSGGYLALLQHWLPGSRLIDCEPIHSLLERDRKNRDTSLGLSLCRVAAP